MLTLRQVNKVYHGEKVLDQISFDVKRGNFLYLLGGSGAGKSTLLRMLATEELPSDGSLTVFGYDLKKVPPTTLKAMRQAIGYIPQKVRLIPDLTVFDNIALSLTLAGRRTLSLDAKSKIAELLGQLGLMSKSETLAGNLSGGESQRVAVARALVRSPELIIADEPTGAQDFNEVWAIMDLLVKASQRGAAVIVATHDREIIKRVQNSCLVLKEGRLQTQGYRERGAY
ncbi:MAG: cell division ATP-binding protein FtsE [Bdellovibrionaceae bacterium]|nr:cell division ATP-binding protein FtsE [Pseudobdellovibrionaceae bacterium]|tara:strand:+ start:2765 stop:3448 length:684 start_codon:yes stop_codon:yes gene_type:complete